MDQYPTSIVRRAPQGEISRPLFISRRGHGTQRRCVYHVLHAHAASADGTESAPCTPDHAFLRFIGHTCSSFNNNGVMVKAFYAR